MRATTGNMFPSLLVVFSALISAQAADLFSKYAHHAVLDPKELMKLYWTVDWDKETVSFAVEAATTGWVGFGFSSGNGKMVGSDVVIGWVKDSKGYLTVGMRTLHTCAKHVSILLCAEKRSGGGGVGTNPRKWVGMCRWAVKTSTMVHITKG